METDDALEDRLAELIRTEVLETEAAPGREEDLFGLGLDSMSIMQLLILLESRMGAVLTEADLTRENFRSIARLAALVAERRSGAPGRRDFPGGQV